MFKTLGAALLALSTASCGRPLTVDFGYVGSDESFAKAALAAGTWNLTCDYPLIVVHRGKGDWELLETGARIECGEGLSVLGCTRPSDQIVMFHGGGEWVLPILAHEFGHALGLPHEAEGIMRDHAGADLMDDGEQTIRSGAISAADCRKVLGQ